jgi:hypothetical protein
MGRRETIAGALAAGVACLVLASPGYAAYKYRAKPFSAEDGAQSATLLFCRGSDRLVGGGLDGGGSYADGVYLNSAFPPVGFESEQWFAYADNYVGGRASNRARAFAVCDTNEERTYSYLRTVTEATVADGTQRDWGRPCDDGEPAVGGGASTSSNYSDEAYIAKSTPYDDGDANTNPDDGWITTMNNDEDASGSSEALFTTAICDRRRKPSAYRYVKAKKSVPDGRQRTRAARCKRGDRLVGGGVDSNSAYEHSAYISGTFPKPGRKRDKWVGSIDNYTTPDGDPVQMTVWAICLK